jgi:hypothetical protein
LIIPAIDNIIELIARSATDTNRTEEVLKACVGLLGFFYLYIFYFAIFGIFQNNCFLYFLVLFYQIRKTYFAVLFILYNVCAIQI